MNGTHALGLIDLAAAGAAPTIAVGGKAQQLGRLLRFGLPVPDGFVLPAPALAAAFAGATRSADSRPPLPEAWRALLQAELARRGWQQTPLAVRSSAPQEDSASASFAGIHRSELNVIGEAALETAIAAVWASLWTAQAAAYRARHGIADGDAAMAVLVMPLLPAVAAGVAFTCEPQTGRDDRIVINAVHGLGEALVGGSENGEEIVLEEDRLSERLTVIARRPGRQSHAVVAKAGSGTTTQPVDAARLVLSDAQAVELGQLLRDAAQALDYADPAWDLEWVFDGGRFLLVQARPVTARRWHTYPGLAGQAAIWSNGNTRDVVPHVMGAMDWIGWRRMVDLMLEQGYRLAGYPLLPGARRSALLHGRLYLNAAFIQWEGYDALGVEPPAMNALLGGHHPEIAVPPPNWRDRLRRAGALLRYVVRSPATRRLGRQQAATAFAEAARWRSEDVARWDDATLIETLRERLIHIRTRNGMMFLQGSSGGNLYLLLDLVGRYLPAERHALVAAVMAGGEPSVTARQAYDLQALAQLAAGHPPTAAWLRRGRPWDLATLPAGSPFGPAFAAFLADYGHRGIYESYLRSPRFRDDPGYLLDNLAALLDCDPAAREARRQAAGEQAWQRLRAALPATRRWWARTLVGIARRESNDRELARSAFVAYSDVSRRLMLEAAGRLVRRGGLAQPEDVFELTPHELFAALAGRLPGPALQARVAHRQRQLAAWDAEAAPEVILGHQAAPLAPAPARRPGGGWHGVAVGSGCAEGTARVIHAPEQGVRLQAGDILVAPSTDPAWTPLFLRAGGLVMETGGYLSHGAIVAREFGIPAVVNLPGILDVLRDGQRLRVDGLRGQVLPLDGGESP